LTLKEDSKFIAIEDIDDYKNQFEPEYDSQDNGAESHQEKVDQER
jgi:hypothetical protein